MTLPDTPPVRPLRDEALDTVKTVAWALGIALVLRIVVFQPYTIPSGSMEPGVQEGDYIIVSKFAYGWSRYSIPFAPPLFHGRILGHGPKRGEAVVFALPREPKKTYIKRVIGLPGDRVQVRDGVVFVNGVVVPRTPEGEASDPSIGGETVQRFRETWPDGKSYVTYDQGPGRPVDDTGVYLTPQDQYFVMGDNRDNSLDGRYPREVGVGFVPAENIVGRAEFLLVSWRPGASLFKPWTWVTHLDLSRLFRRLA